MSDSSSRLQPVRGTHDLLGEGHRRHHEVVQTAREIAGRYGFEEISTPIFEFTEVFKRTLGDTSDVVTKEMYTFEDRGGDSITLRPEATAGIARALISGGLSQDLPLKFFCHGPMFRYERPQKGRLRQFHQIDVELLGVPEPQADIEVIACGQHILEALGVAKDTTLEINTLGDGDSRKAYREALVKYFSGHKEKLSADSLARLERNPMRILDSKDDGDRSLVADAPRFSEHINEASKQFFATVCGGLEALGIRYRRNERLVRGLDYYCHTAFEFTTTALGAQGTVMGGGRYDGLVETMGGPATAGVGWAAGIERLALLLVQPPQVRRPISVIPGSAAGEGKALMLAHALRQAGHAVDMFYRGNVGRRMKRANKVNARVAVILGDDELARNAAMVRDLDSGQQQEVALDRLTEYLKPYL
ncbi:MAG: histidine--tRNA ligase [Alphaproteobacteria bacterium]|jgi:histidyl-tRNA synthetase|nr:histidine--tRNA ligase [Alphaproteobacteria bacterium]